MRAEGVNRISRKVILGLSLLALFTVITGYCQAPQPDEGAGAHIFQLSITALVPMVLLFFVTADWKRPSENARVLAVPAAALVLAFAALYYLEHYFYVR